MDKEAKRKNFERLAVRRVNEALDKIDSLKAFTNKSFYDATNSDYKKILKALREAVEDLEAHYLKKPKAKEHFNL